MTNGFSTNGVVGKNNHFDVAILGTGISGTILGSILARQGASVLMIDAGTHPRFAIGESTVPNTSRMLDMLADRFDVPELRYLSSFKRINKNISTTCGVKRNFGFIYHRQGQPPNFDEANQVVIPGALIDDEAHIFRQDIDAFYLNVAVRYGATVRQALNIKDVDIDADSVTLTASTGERFYARYVVDGSGYRSPLADKFNLRENPSRLRAHTRTTFTHMIGVKRYDDCVQPVGAYHNPSPWAEGTLHHIFDGGWLWVIPFNNHKDSTNPLISVGLQYDSRRRPRTLPPDQEFAAFLKDFPEIAVQFKDARRVRDWVQTDRLQYSSKQSVGDRFCLMAHANGFIDPLFSRGLAATMEIINVVAVRLLEALKDDDFSAERFAYVENFQQKLLDTHDDLVNNSFIAFRHFPLWNAWLRVWALGQGFSEIRLIHAHMKFRETHDHSLLSNLEKSKNTGMLWSSSDEYKQLWDTATTTIRNVEAGLVDPQDATERVMEAIRTANFGPPFFEIGDPDVRYIQFKPSYVARAVRWRFTAPPSPMKTFQDESGRMLFKRFMTGRKA